MTTLTPPPRDASTTQIRKLQGPLVRILKVALVILILWALGRHLWALTREWGAQGNSLYDLPLSGSWLTVSTAACLSV